MQASPRDSGIRGRTFVHDPRVFNFLTGQSGSITPFQASIRVYSLRPNRLVTTISTGADGRFQVQLRPGLYRLEPDTMWHGRVLQPDEIVIGSYEAAHPVTIEVRPHRFAPLTITYERMMGF